MNPTRDDDTGEAPRFLSRADLEDKLQAGLDSLGHAFARNAMADPEMVPFSSRPRDNDDWIYDDTEGIPVGLPDLLTPRPALPRDATDEWTDEGTPPTLGVPADALYAAEQALAAARRRTWTVGVGALVLGALLGAGAVAILG